MDTKILESRNVYWRPASSAHQDILRRAALELSSGEVAVIKGLPGSGKTIFLRILSGRIEPASGEVYYLGSSLKPAAARRLLFSQSALIDRNLSRIYNGDTVLQNIEQVLSLYDIPAKIIFDRAVHVMKLTGLIQKRDTPTEKLSEYEKNMFGFAVALAREVTLLFCDINVSGSAEDEEALRIIRMNSGKGGAAVVTAYPGFDSGKYGFREITIEKPAE